MRTNKSSGSNDVAHTCSPDLSTPCVPCGTPHEQATKGKIVSTGRQVARCHGTRIVQPFIREVTITFRGDARDELHVDRADGMVMIALTPEEALAMTLADDKRISQELHITVITRITWENVPGGFVPPNSDSVKCLPRATVRKQKAR